MEFIDRQASAAEKPNAHLSTALGRLPQNNYERNRSGSAAVMPAGSGYDFSLIPVASGTRRSVGPPLRGSTVGDSLEQEADRIADYVTGRSAARPLRIHSLGSSHLASGAEPSSGQPLDINTRGFMEIRFGQDFSKVRVHTGPQAADSARAVGAHAYTAGSSIIFADGRYAPGTPTGDHLLAHELTHILQNGTGGRLRRAADARPAPQPDKSQVASSPDHPRAPVDVTASAVCASTPTIWRKSDPAAAAIYPTATEREQVQEVLNPQHQHAVETGTNEPPVDDPAAFQKEMTALLDPYIDKVLAGAQRIQASSVVVGLPEIQGLGDIAQAEVASFYGTYLTAAIHSPQERQRRAGYKLREHLHEVPSAATAATDDAAKDWVASRMHAQGSDLLNAHHVVAGANARDQKLFLNVRDSIFTHRTNDLRTIIRFFPGYEDEETKEAYIQPRVAPHEGETASDALRRGRWMALGTTIHESLHAAAHEDFSQRVTGLEESGIAVEGFAEYFTRPVYDHLSQRAAEEASLRSSIEGTAAPYTVPPSRTAYATYVAAVKHLRDILNGNEENLKVAYFMGRLEFIGLGGWNETEAAKRRFPGNVLGAAALLTDAGGGYFRVQYGRVLLGRGGAFQFQLGGTLSYLTENQRLGLGGSSYLQYSWPDVYVRGGLDVTGSASAAHPLGQSVRLDLIPGAEVGVRVGVVRVGANAQLIIPVAGGPISDRTVRLAAGLGVSVAF